MRLRDTRRIASSAAPTGNVTDSGKDVDKITGSSFDCLVYCTRSSREVGPWPDGEENSCGSTGDVADFGLVEAQY